MDGLGSVKEGKEIFEGCDLKLECPIGVQTGEGVLRSINYPNYGATEEGLFIYFFVSIGQELFLGHCFPPYLACSAPKLRVEPQAELVIQSSRYSRVVLLV